MTNTSVNVNLLLNKCYILHNFCMFNLIHLQRLQARLLCFLPSDRHKYSFLPAVTFLVLGYGTLTKAMNKRKNLFGAYGVGGSESMVITVRSTVTDKQMWCWRGRELTSWDTTTRQRKLSGMKKSSVFDPSPWNGPPSFRVSPPTLVNQI